MWARGPWGLWRPTSSCTRIPALYVAGITHVRAIEERNGVEYEATRKGKGVELWCIPCVVRWWWLFGGGGGGGGSGGSGVGAMD